MIITLLVVVAGFAAEASDRPEPPLFHAGNEELAQYIREALSNDPGLKARYAEWRAAIERVPQVTALDDPMFMYSDFLTTQDKRFAIAVEQKFPWFGTLRAKGDKALADADAALARFHAARNAAIAEVKRAYFEYGLLGERIKVAASQADILKYVEELVRSRYSLGLNTEADLVRIQIEKGKLEDMRNGLLQARPAWSAKLAQALGREVAEELPWPQDVPFPIDPPPAPVILAQVRIANPDLEALQRGIEAWKKEAVVAKQKGLPEFSLALEYADMKDERQHRGRMRQVWAADAVRMVAADKPTTVGALAKTAGDIAYDIGKEQYTLPGESVRDDLMVTLRCNVPIWREKVNAGVREAQQMEAAATHDKRKMAIVLETAVRGALFDWEDATRRYGLYKDTLIPKAAQSYQSQQTAYGTGAAEDFLGLLDAVRTLLEFKLEQARAASERHVACAQLEMLMGGPWETEAQGVK